MTGKQLKNSILQWAIQGKLVPQDPTDEPASVLLEKIRQEKERLIKEKKIKRDKNASIIYRGEDNSYYENILATGEVKCIDDEIPFEIPQGWEWERIGNILETTSGSTPLSKNPDYYKDGSINWVRTTDLNNGILDKAEIQITERAYSDYNLVLLPQNSVCIAMYGGSGTIGKHSILHFDTTINQSVCAIKPNGFCDMDYVHIFIEYQRPYWMDFASGSRKDPNINQLIIKHCLLPIPPQKEQARIVEKLSLLYPYINRYRECQIMLENINREIWNTLKKSVLQEAIQGKLVPQIAEEGTAQELLEQIKAEKQKLVKEGKLKKSALNDSVIFRGDDNKYWEKSGDNIVCIDEEIPFGIPSSWSWCRLGNIASVKGGKRIPVGEKLTTENTGHMYIRVADMKENTVKTDDIHYISESIYQKIKSYTISTEDLYITVAGTIGSVGEIPKVFDNANLTENADKIVFRGLCKRFLMYCLLSNFVQSQIKKCTTKVGQPKLAIVRIEDLLIPLPPIKEQYRIVHKIEQTASIMSR